MQQTSKGFLFFPRKQDLTSGACLHEMSNHIFWEKIEICLWDPHPHSMKKWKKKIIWWDLLSGTMPHFTAIDNVGSFTETGAILF